MDKMSMILGVIALMISAIEPAAVPKDVLVFTDLHDGVVELSLPKHEVAQASPPGYFVYEPVAVPADVGLPLRRQRRQNHFGFGGSSNAAQASSQGFNVPGPYGFGASASQAGTQGFQFGPGGFGGSAGQSGSQTYRFPNGYSATVAFSDGFSVGPGGPTRSGGSTVTFTGPNGATQKFQG